LWINISFLSNSSPLIRPSGAFSHKGRRKNAAHPPYKRLFKRGKYAHYFASFSLVDKGIKQGIILLPLWEKVPEGRMRGMREVPTKHDLISHF